MRKLWMGLVSLGVLVAASSGADATVTFQTGNQQYTNVNIAADTNATSLTGEIGNTGINLMFENMIGPDCSTQVTMHGQHGVAFVQSAADSAPGATDTGFCSITLVPDAGFGLTAGDFALDQLSSLTSPTGEVFFSATDQFGNVTDFTEAISQNGQNQYNFFTADGELVTSLTISVPSTDLLEDLKQVSVNAVPVPEPMTLSLFGASLVGLALMLRRRRKLNTA